ncbi:hypothetical protein D1007_45116 [Hordeum vulgare]|nr:hypothetical protein D1007_45116 [Hordeum vulgare]
MVTSRAGRSGDHGLRQGEEEDSNWDTPRSRNGLPSPNEAQIGGEVVMDDVAFVAVDFEEEEDELEEAERWNLLGLYRAQKCPSAKTLPNHFEKIWQLRTGLEFKPLESNHFVIKLFSEGDFNFVGRGGPWIYDGNALLVAPFDGEARPSESILDSVPVWVRVFDVSWKKQTRVYGKAIGGTLGEVLEVDAPESGHAMNEFLRIRVKLPYNRRLQKEVILEYKVQGNVKRSVFQLKYECVPHFCFHCGFMGHDKLACEKKLLGLPSKAYDSTLRCSPYKKFEHRTAYTPSPGQPRARQGMSFCFGSAGSATNVEHLGSSGSSKLNEEVGIPQRVDAHDNFEQGEIPGSDDADQTLAKEVDNMNLHLQKEKAECSQKNRMDVYFNAKAPITGGGEGCKQRKKKSGVPKKVPGGRRSGNLVIRDAPLGSDDMIPAIRGLSTISSFGTASASSDGQDSILGKRQVDGMLGFDLVADATNAMVPFVADAPGGVQKKGKVDTDQSVEKGSPSAGAKMDSKTGSSTAAHEESSTAREPEVKWLPPPPGWTKLNVDGAFKADGNTGGVGMILRERPAR